MFSLNSENMSNTDAFLLLIVLNIIFSHLICSCTGKWYCMSRRCQKLLLFIMNRSMSPCKITAGKIMNLSIESFGTVRKLVLSLRTFLYNYNLFHTQYVTYL